MNHFKKRLAALLLLAALLAVNIVEAGAATGKGAVRQEAAEASVEIENNGGHFVRIGDAVYFRVYGPDALPATALHAEFMQAVTGGRSSIQRYDLKSGKCEELFEDGGYGGIWYFQDSFWLNRSTDFGNIIYTVDPETGKSEDIAWGSILGLSSDGSHLVYEGRNDQGVRAFMTWGEEDYINSVYGTENEYLTYCGAVGGDIYFLSHNFETGKERDELWQLAAVGDRKTELILLGTFPGAENGNTAQFVQFLADKDKIYVSVEYREGTGHFYAGSHYVSALPGKKNSMKLLDQEAQKAREAADKAAAKSAGKSGQEEDPETLKMYLDKAGRIAFAPHLPGEMDVRYEDGAFDLVLYDRAGILTEQDAVTVRKAWLPEFEYTDEKDISCNPQIMEYVGGRAFTVYTESMRDPENDIGWRYAYKLSRTVYELCEPEKDAEQIAAVEAARFLTPEEVTAFNKELDPDHYGFFLSDYRNPTEINWSEVLYNGAGISVQPGKKELDAYLEASGMDELYTDVTAIRGKDLNSFVFKTTGTPYKNALRPLILSWTYLPKYDLYLHMAGDTNHQQIEFSNGWDLGDHTYRLRYTVSAPDRQYESWPYEATVRVENGQWTFLSNLPE